MVGILKRREKYEQAAGRVIEAREMYAEAGGRVEEVMIETTEAEQRLREARKADKGGPETDESPEVLASLDVLARLIEENERVEEAYHDAGISETTLEMDCENALEKLRQARIDVQEMGMLVRLSDLAESDFVMISDPAMIERLSDGAVHSGFLVVMFGKFRPDMPLWEVVEAWAGEFFPEPDSLIRKVV